MVEMKTRCVGGARNWKSSTVAPMRVQRVTCSVVLAVRKRAEGVARTTRQNVAGEATNAAKRSRAVCKGN